MRRLFQILAVVQLALVVALGLRVVEVLRTEPPEFGEIADTPVVATIPPPKPRAKISPAVTNAVVSGDLFDAERGTGAPTGVDPDIVVDEAPVAPPTSVTLTGVIVIGAEPVAILSDPSVGPEQQSLRRGEMLGDYEVGEIGAASVVLLGTSGQQFHVPLKIGGGGGGGGAAPGTPGVANPPGTPRPTPANRPPQGQAAARAVPKPGRGEPEPMDETKSMTARERAQAIAQRNAAVRGKAAGNNNNDNKGEKGGGNNKDEDGGPDPVQARLDALRRLREAAKSR